MSTISGDHQLGPANAELSVRTGRTGAAAKAGHDLLIRVNSWQATLSGADDPAAVRVELTADPTSLEVVDGGGGVQPLTDDDRSNIAATIEEKVLGQEEIRFRSTSASAAEGGALRIEGELTIAGSTQPIGFDLRVGGDGELSASATVTQTEWGITPHSALFGALKVADDVQVGLEGHL